MNNLPAVNTNTNVRSQEQIQMEALRGLQQEIPLNDFNLPVGIYRTDLLPFHDYVSPTQALTTENRNEEDPRSRSTDIELGASGESEDVLNGSQDGSSLVASQARPLSDPAPYRIAGFPAEALSRAFVPLQYDEGFPAFENGIPFWGRLDFEPVDAYQAFQRYLEMNLGVAADLEIDDDIGRPASGTRSISQLAATLHPDSNLLKMADIYQNFYHLYYWGKRAHAYDLFRVAQYRKMQELRAVETQDEHYVTARRLRAKLMTYFDNDEDFWDMMTPKVGIDLLKTLVGIERVSSGMPAAGPQTAEQTENAGKPFEMVLQTIAQVNRPRGEGHTLDGEGGILDNALDDPETVKLLQSIIIKGG